MGEYADEAMEREMDQGYFPLGGFSTPRKRLPAHYKRAGKNIKVPVISETTSTDKAVLLVLTIDDENHERWLPRSQIKYEFADMVEIADWLFEKILDEIKSK